MKAAVIGAGVIGGGWAARFLLNGHDVAVYDPSQQAVERLGQVVSDARGVFLRLYDTPLPPSGKLYRCSSIAAAVDGADWVQESVAERLEIKTNVLTGIELAASPLAIVGSSTSGYRPSVLAADLQRPDRFLVVHPFNPVYLIPLIEMVPSQWTSEETLASATATMTGLGMKPLHVRHEIDGFIGNRLQEAMWREALWLIEDGIASAAEIDDAVKYGFGLRMAQMGQFETFRVAGGDLGMRHFLAQFGPSLSAPLSRLTDVPELDEALISTIVEQTEAPSGDVSIRDLERMRDLGLVGILRALKEAGVSAGQTVTSHEERLKAQESARSQDVSLANA